MNRSHLIEQSRRIRAAESRDPVDAVLYGLACLTVDRLRDAVGKFNDVFSDNQNVPKIVLAEKEIHE